LASVRRTATQSDQKATARQALEEVCSGNDLAGIPEVYHPDFVDHVNSLEYRGHDGARRSVALYLELFPDLRFVVDEQMTEGDRVASRWTLRGTHRGRSVTLRGIVISRFEDGRIIEDWAASDTMEILRQLGIWRSLLLLVQHRRLLRNRSGPRLSDETERVRRLQDKEAPRYDRQISFFERTLFGGGREWVCAQAEGEVLELAAGTARNLAHYPAGVSVTGIELSPGMLAIGRMRAEELGRDADLRVGDVQALDFPDETFDSVVCTLGLCTIPEPRKAVAEAHRVLCPGGKLLLLEHVRSPLVPIRVVERLLEPLAVRFAADHLTREPLDYLEAEDFKIERLERSKLGIVERVAARKGAPSLR
jgi:ubiquinone/menaquinone biosynthesis C-methylase UbiE/predicted ester cyclase